MHANWPTVFLPFKKRYLHIVWLDNTSILCAEYIFVSNTLPACHLTFVSLTNV